MKNKKSTKYISSLQEKQVAKNLNANIVPGSGGGKWQKGDVSLDDWLLECKTSMSPKNSYSIKKDVINKIKKQSFEMQKENYALVFNFGPGEKNYVIIDENTFKYLLENQKEIEE